MVGETNRAPFDLPEAESELVAGFHTEYTSIKFAMFFLAEYINVIDGLGAGDDAVPRRLAGAVAAVADRPRRAQHRLVAGAVVPRQGARASSSSSIWLRGTLPRLRYDQFMALGWKVLIPASLVWIMIVAAFRELTNEGRSRQQTLLYVGIPLAGDRADRVVLRREPSGAAGRGGDARASALPRFPIPVRARRLRRCTTSPGRCGPETDTHGGGR